jgi:hypothetical protein
MRGTSLLVLLLLGAIALICVPGANALFGLRGGSSKPATAKAASTGSPDAPAPPDSDKGAEPSSAPPSDNAMKAADPADPYPFPPSLDDMQDYEAWADDKGELHIIRAQRLPSGEYEFPEGTVVSVPISIWPPSLVILSLCSGKQLMGVVTGAEGSPVNGPNCNRDERVGRTLPVPDPGAQEAPQSQVAGRAPSPRRRVIRLSPC